MREHGYNIRGMESLQLQAVGTIQFCGDIIIVRQPRHPVNDLAIKLFQHSQAIQLSRRNKTRTTPTLSRDVLWTQTLNADFACQCLRNSCLPTNQYSAPQISLSLRSLCKVGIFKITQGALNRHFFAFHNLASRTWRCISIALSALSESSSHIHIRFLILSSITCWQPKYTSSPIIEHYRRPSLLTVKYFLILRQNEGSRHPRFPYLPRGREMLQNRCALARQPCWNGARDSGCSTTFR